MNVRMVVRRDDFPRVLASLPNANDRIVQRYAKDSLLPEAKRQQAPHIDTGALNRSGSVAESGFGFAIVRFTGGAPGWYDGLPRIYAAYHEYGTRVTGEYPFMRPAIEATFPSDVYRIGEQELRNLL